VGAKRLRLGLRGAAGLALLLLTPAGLLPHQGAPALAAKPAKGGKAIVGYYADWDNYCSACLSLTRVPFGHLSALIFAFADASKDSCALRTGDATRDFPILRRARRRYPRLQVLLSVNSSGSGSSFADAVSSGRRIDRLVANCDRVIRSSHVFSGVDIDWEGPHTSRERREYTALIRAFRRRLGRAAPVTAAVSTYFNIDWKHVGPLLSWINLMTYDFHGPWGDRVTDFLAPVRANPRDPEYKHGYSVVGNLDRLIHHDGVRPGKVMLGIPFYGRGYAGVRPRNRGLYQPYSGPTSFGTIGPGVFEYRDLVAHYIGKEGYRRYGPDRYSQESWLYRPGKRGGIFISFDAPSTIRAKVALIRSYHLAGAMVWDLADDTLNPKTSLLTALARSLR